MNTFGFTSISSAMASFNASRTVNSFAPAGVAYPLLLDIHDDVVGAIDLCAVLKEVEVRGVESWRSAGRSNREADMAGEMLEGIRRGGIDRGKEFEGGRNGVTG